MHSDCYSKQMPVMQTPQPTRSARQWLEFAERASHHKPCTDINTLVSHENDQEACPYNFVQKGVFYPREHRPKTEHASKARLGQCILHRPGFIARSFMSNSPANRRTLACAPPCMKPGLSYREFVDSCYFRKLTFYKQVLGPKGSIPKWPNGYMKTA